MRKIERPVTPPRRPEWLEDQFREGVRARKAGRSLNSCTYPRMSRKRRSWRAGWTDQDMIERVEKESGNVPEVAKTDMRKYPWEVVLLDGWAVPEHPGVDMRPRKFRDELVAILVATRWNRNGPFRHVVRPRKTWDTTKCDYSDNTISEI